LVFLPAVQFVEFVALGVVLVDVVVLYVVFHLLVDFGLVFHALFVILDFLQSLQVAVVQKTPGLQVIDELLQVTKPLCQHSVHSDLFPGLTVVSQKYNTTPCEFTRVS